MKLWNGWGEEDYTYHIPQSALNYLYGEVGEGTITTDVPKEDILRIIPQTRVRKSHLLDTNKEERLRHACGQSLPDWINLRYGTLKIFPDAVAFPDSEECVMKILQMAIKNQWQIIPYGGGSSVVGHLNIIHPDVPTISVDLARMNTLLSIDTHSHIANFGAGIRGPNLESELARFGFLLGHYPQSHEFSTLGGWIASRSVGTQCYYYGRIEHLFLGGRLISPEGIFEISFLTICIRA